MTRAAPTIFGAPRSGTSFARGVPERVAMELTGHKTRAVFDRYHIVSPADLQDVARRLAGTFSGTSHLPQVDPRLVTSDDIGTRL